MIVLIIDMKRRDIKRIKPLEMDAMIVYNIFRLIWDQTGYDRVDDFKINMEYDRGMRG